jgi:HEPN domain-containing protein
MNIRRLNTDIVLARNALSPATNPTNDEYFYDAAGYHIQQAIEKELKHILSDVYGVDENRKRFRTHNISSLILFIAEFDQTFPKRHSDLIEIADELTEWETKCRYNEDLVTTRRSVESALHIAESLLVEIQELDKQKTQAQNMPETIEPQSAPKKVETLIEQQSSRPIEEINEEEEEER